MYRPLPLWGIAILTACSAGQNQSLPPSSGTFTLHSDQIVCRCVETGVPCGFWQGRRPPPQPGGTVALLRERSTGQLLGFACERGGLTLNSPHEVVPASNTNNVQSL